MENLKIMKNIKKRIKMSLHKYKYTSIINNRKNKLLGRKWSEILTKTRFFKEKFQNRMKIIISTKTKTWIRVFITKMRWNPTIISRKIQKK